MSPSDTWKKILKIVAVNLYLRKDAVQPLRLLPVF